MLKWFLFMHRSKLHRDLTKLQLPLVSRELDCLIAVTIAVTLFEIDTHMEAATDAPMEELPEELPEALRAAMAADGEQLVKELQLLAQMPQVRIMPSGVFDRAKPPGSVPQLRGVIVRLRCCNKPFDQKCNALEGEKACPSHVEAAQMLQAKILEKHGSEACLEAAQAALAKETAERQSAGESSSGARAENAFAEMLGRQLAIQKAQRAVTLAQETAVRLTKAEKEASLAREAADTALEDVRLQHGGPAH